MAAVVIVFSSGITIAIAIVSTGDVVERIADAEVIAAGGALWNEEGIVLVVRDHAPPAVLLGNVSEPNTDAAAILAQLPAAGFAKARISTNRMLLKWLLMEWHVLFVCLSTECRCRPDAVPIAVGERR